MKVKTREPLDFCAFVVGACFRWFGAVVLGCDSLLEEDGIYWHICSLILFVFNIQLLIRPV